MFTIKHKRHVTRSWKGEGKGRKRGGGGGDNIWISILVAARHFFLSSAYTLVRCFAGLLVCFALLCFVCRTRRRNTRFDKENEKMKKRRSGRSVWRGVCVWERERKREIERGKKPLHDGEKEKWAGKIFSKTRKTRRWWYGGDNKQL